MLNLLQRESLSKTGFTLIEVVLAIGLTGMMIILFFLIMQFSHVSSNRIHQTDDYLLNGRYATEYILEDVMLADDIVSIDDYCPDGFEKDDMMGFFIINKEIDDYGDVHFKHIYYEMEHNSLSRITFTANQECPEKPLNNGGKNRFLHNIIGLGDSGFDSETLILLIEIEMQDPETGKKYLFFESKYLGNF